MYELTGFQRDILYCIAPLDDPTGIEIKQEVTQYIGEEVNHGRLYPNLDELADKNLINKAAKNNRANVYQLTESGVNLIQNRRKWENLKLEHLGLELTEE